MAQKIIKGPVDDNSLNSTNHNFTELYDEKRKSNERINKIVDEMSDEAFNKVVNSARLDWDTMVEKYSDLPSDAETGTTIGVKEDSLVYRYDGSKWVDIYEINLNPISEVDERLSSQLAETVKDTLKSYGVVGNANFISDDGTIWADSDHTIPATDDTEAIQNALNSDVETIVFDGGKTYLISESLKVDLDKVKRIDGNGATLIITSDNPAIDVEGNLTGTANPNSVNDSLILSEHGSSISNLRITSNSKKIGTGIKISKTLGLIISKCDFFFLKDGIKFTGKNRNTIIDSCHIYACDKNGVLFERNGDLHQINITGCHISYCEVGILSDDHAIYNMQITGNDIEVSGYPRDRARHCMHVIANNNIVEDINITGNTIEDHHLVNQIIYLESSSRGKISTVSITGNGIGNANRNCVGLKNVSSVTLTGNSFKSGNGYPINIIDSITGCTITGNSFYTAGVIESSTENEEMTTLINLTLSNNNAQVIMPRDGISIQIIKFVNAAFHMINISNNVIFMPVSGIKNEKYLIDIVPSGDLESMNLSNNSIKVRDYCNHGVRVEEAPSGKSTTHLKITGNSIRGHHKDKYKIPDKDISEHFLIKENR